MNEEEFAKRFWSSPIVAGISFALGIGCILGGIAVIYHPPVAPNEHPVFPGKRCMIEVPLQNLVGVGGRRRIEGRLKLTLDATSTSGKPRHYEGLDYELKEEDWKHEWQGVVHITNAPGPHLLPLEIAMPDDPELWGGSATLKVTGDVVYPTYMGPTGPQGQKTFENVQAKLVREVPFTFEKEYHDLQKEREDYARAVEGRGTTIAVPIMFGVLFILCGFVALSNFLKSKR